MHYFVNNCTTCGKYGMVFVILLRDGTLAAECDECYLRYDRPEDIGMIGKGTYDAPHSDTLRTATWDEIVRAEWDRYPWEAVPFHHYWRRSGQPAAADDSASDEAE